VHVTALQCLRVKPRKTGLNMRLKSVLRGGGAGSHTSPNQVIRKWMVNMTLSKGHYAQTRHTARKYFNVSHDSSTPYKNLTLLFLTGEDDIARFDSRQYRDVWWVS
jgi:hypothetical protein